MEASKTFDFERAYRAVDDWGYGFVDRKNLHSFFRKHNIKLSKAHLTAVIRRLDLDGDSKINKKEFLEGLTPDECYSKHAKRLTFDLQMSEPCAPGERTRSPQFRSETSLVVNGHSSKKRTDSMSLERAFQRRASGSLSSIKRGRSTNKSHRSNSHHDRFD